ncbi:MAG: nicotinate phosphoribosyltransferase [Acetilactobacillus jinshanensis]
MMQTYWGKHLQNRRAVFEMFFRTNPFGNGYAIFTGLQHVIDYLNHLHFTDDDIKYLKSTHFFNPQFLDWLRHFKFKGTIRSAHEGDLVFAHEPIFQAEGSIMECQLIETAVLNIINYQTLVATKASRIKIAAGNDPVMEFGSRRAQEVSAAIWGTRAAYIGGFDATSNVLAGKLFGLPIAGTHAHSLVELYGNDYKAFKAYAETHHNCTFLVDTYDTLKSGVPAAIRVAKEMGNRINFQAVRLDSGDMAYLSKRVRQMLDAAGFTNTKIVASNGLDENIITNLKMQHAKIDAWGVGTQLITAYDQPSLGGVYKLVAIDDGTGHMRNAMKLTNNPAKITTPGKKQVWRVTSGDGKSEGDYITIGNENPNREPSLFMFHPQYTYINKTLTGFRATPLLKLIYKHGKQVYHEPDVNRIKRHANASLASLWPEYKRQLNPQKYPVDLSKRCWENKQNTIKRIR